MEELEKTVEEILAKGYIKSKLHRVKADAELWQSEIQLELSEEARSALLTAFNKELVRARIKEVNWLRKNWAEFMLPEDIDMFDNRIKSLQSGGKHDRGGDDG